MHCDSICWGKWVIQHEDGKSWWLSTGLPAGYKREHRQDNSRGRDLYFCMANKSELFAPFFHQASLIPARICKVISNMTGRLSDLIAQQCLSPSLLAALSESKPNNSHSFDMKIHLSVFLRAKEVISQMAEWCSASQKRKKKRRKVAGDGESEGSKKGKEIKSWFLV